MLTISTQLAVLPENKLPLLRANPALLIDTSTPASGHLFNMHARQCYHFSLLYKIKYCPY